ncbi:putative oxygen-evolving enhancer protein [Helianthus annuus]|uniref:Oxygen-evolving enhancer protein n=1 Tax=Helianthus annuus TaxID=4232 RepID=A0A251TZK5_HELAN|nr:psbQ-like protein 3, chloroplastic [Helianthus annuus]KAF5792635.1 putative oxygen-evolving enhancer protein [Helianthus annuus]KAJ0527560.1 putative oxygen-evolving enhancer protein [Helianthus annuus]KAJ0543968.1 putative oxygen-evolving enhancer protein [Helianthus annuus]KAJ0709024.1 putative oxygen-evolving enhancer protein [Helianthus annuus]
MSAASTYALSCSYAKYPNENRKKETKLKSKHTHITRRKASSLFLLICSPIPFHAEPASATESSFLDMFRMTIPDQTVEEAENGIREHAMSLVQVKELLELESWKEAQKELRKSASLLKQDIYTIIQAKPGMERAQLRNLYSKLFNGVTGLDYAARDKDVPRVWNLYEEIVVTLDDILSRV